MTIKKPIGSLSIDLDNTWSYLNIHGNAEAKVSKSHFPISVPRVLKILEELNLKITFMIVGRDAADPESYEWIQRIVKSGHELGNHSFDHEPWMQDKDEEAVYQELLKAHEAIYQASGTYPVGFRGPGFCHSNSTLNAVRRLDYLFDASILPTVIGPLARLYYFSSMKKLPENEMGKRKHLFGGLSDALLPNHPFFWNTSDGQLLEIPVTTIPFLRVPFHLSYLIWLLGFSEKLAWTYLQFSIRMCKLAGIAPSILLHPPDFLGPDDVPSLSFFPGMQLELEKKLTFVQRALRELSGQFQLVPMSQHAKSVLAVRTDKPKLYYHRVT